eukprot:TRINITY_DN2255_c0_g1_i1.p1 TRINITY_DN2255_c0_g1~~TRINITY_DN2255_c0_g1_i1.p1  ORF type:complete len:156 (+),score=35.59 TRINITY_DN2255_c0_g1_i1:72-470(+)
MKTRRRLEQYAVERGRLPGVRYTRSEGALVEIQQQQASTSMLIPKATFQRLVKSIMLGLSWQTSDKVDGQELEWRMESQALMALQEGTEQFLIGLLEDASICSVHAKRVTVAEKDVQLAQRLRGDPTKKVQR